MNRHGFTLTPGWACALVSVLAAVAFVGGVALGFYLLATFA